MIQVIAGARARRPNARMSDTLTTLQYRIALYRRYLAEGVSADLAGQYLQSIARAEEKLAELQNANSESASPGGESSDSRT